LLYNMHVRSISTWQMRLFERFQTRILRGIDGRGRHITRETNDGLRIRFNVPSIESLLRVRRLQFWRSILRGGNATLGIRMAAFSPTQFDGSPLVAEDQPMLLKMLKSDLVFLRKANDEQHLNINDAPFLTGDDLITLEHITDASIIKLFRFDAPAEDNAEAREGKRQRKNERTNDPTTKWIACPQCQQKTVESRLAQHMWASHSMRHVDSIAIIDKKCPSCSRPFKSRFGVTKHYAKCKVSSSGYQGAIRTQAGEQFHQGNPQTRLAFSSAQPSALPAAAAAADASRCPATAVRPQVCIGDWRLVARAHRVTAKEAAAGR
jgi:hypothetical protein